MSSSQKSSTEEEMDVQANSSQAESEDPVSPTKFFRKSREKIRMLSASSTAQIKTRLRRTNSNLSVTKTNNSRIEKRRRRRLSSTQSAASNELNVSLEAKSPSQSPTKTPPDLSPIQITIRRLYEKIRRTHKANLTKNKISAWAANKEMNSYIMGQHDLYQHEEMVTTKSLFKPTSSSSATTSSQVDVVTGDDILQATRNASCNRATTAKQITVKLKMPEELQTFGGKTGLENQTIPVLTINHISQIPPVLDWTAVPHNLHEDDEKFLTNIPFLGDEVIEKDTKFIDEMVTLYEGKIHQADDDSNLRKVDNEVFVNLVQAMMEIELEEGPDVFKDCESQNSSITDSQISRTSLDEGKGKATAMKEKEDPRLSPKKTFTPFTEVVANLFPIPLTSSTATTTLKNSRDETESTAQKKAKTEKFNLPGVNAHQQSVDTQDSNVQQSQLKSSEKSPHVTQKSVVEKGTELGVESLPSKSIMKPGSSSRPSEDIFNLLSKTFTELGTPNEIRERYENAEKLLKSGPLPILPNGLEEQPPESYTLPNIDGPYAKCLPKESSMHAFQTLFCRRCYAYDCKRHTGEDQVDVKYYKPGRLTSQASSSTSSTGANGATSFVCRDPECWKNMTTVSRNPDDILKEWSPNDRSLFICCINSWPSNYCFIANILSSKSCAQVKEYADLETLPKPESSTTASLSRTRPKYRKQRPGYAKKLSGNSNNKRNLTRQWIKNLKKIERSKEEGGIKSAGKLPPRFMPCIHEDGGECDSSCSCRINKTSCEKFCTCSLTCRYRFPGCKCQSTCDSKRCICFAAARECDPDLCLGCGAGETQVDKINCHNINIQRKLHKHLLMGQSDVSGWGIYIKKDTQRGEFIAEYRGELISHDESERRGHIYDKIQHTFLFELNDHFVVDATRKGNKARFVNSSKNPNCEVKRMLVNGDHRIGIYAKRFIEAGEELFYDYQDVLEKQQKQAKMDEEEANAKRKRNKRKRKQAVLE